MIEDISDLQVDSALFLGGDSLKLFTLAHGDYNGDGFVNTLDYIVWSKRLGVSPANYYDGDGNGNGVVDQADYNVWATHFGESGNRDFCSDFNRDGVVNETDLNNPSPYYEVLHECASRFEGDADGDGDVDGCDLDIWGSENGATTPLRPCECASGGEQAMMAASPAEPEISKEQIPTSPDVDGDGDVDQSDIAALNAILGVKPGGPPVAEEAGPEPTPAEEAGF